MSWKLTKIMKKSLKLIENRVNKMDKIYRKLIEIMKKPSETHRKLGERCKKLIKNNKEWAKPKFDSKYDKITFENCPNLNKQPLKNHRKW